MVKAPHLIHSSSVEWIKIFLLKVNSESIQINMCVNSLRFLMCLYFLMSE